MFPYHTPLPDGAEQQDGREDQVHQIVRHQHDAERYHNEAHEDKRGIDQERTLDLIAFHTEQQGEQDYAQQPRIFHQQTAGHDQEVLIGKRPEQSDNNSKGNGRGGEDDAGTLLQERLGMEPLGQKAESQEVQDYRNDGEDEDT